MTTIRTTTTRSTPPRLVVATYYEVVGTRGRRRVVLLVPCPWCGYQHLHSAKGTFIAGRRTASSHLGRYEVHVGAMEGAAA